MMLRDYFFINGVEYLRDVGKNYGVLYIVIRRSPYLRDYYYEGEQLGEITFEEQFK